MYEHFFFNTTLLIFNSNKNNPIRKKSTSGHIKNSVAEI